MQSMGYPSVSAMKRSLPGAEDDELWFLEDTLEYPLFVGAGVAPDPPSSDEEENLDDFLMMVESMDADESLKPGICAENLNESSNPQQKCPLTPIRRYAEQRPKTPPTTKPSFNELPPIISPDIYMEEKDSNMSSPVDEAFLPPRGHHSFPHISRHPQLYVPNHYERTLLNKLASSMRRSHSSRQEILRQRHLFANHPSMYEIERLEHRHRRVWSFIASQQGYP